MPELLAVADTNWFYSTLAQSTAAIVGLVGAFLIQRILAIRSEVILQRSEVRRDSVGFWDENYRVLDAMSLTREGLVNIRSQLEAGLSREESEVEISSPVPGEFGLVDADGRRDRKAISGEYPQLIEEPASLRDAINEAIVALDSIVRALPPERKGYLRRPVTVPRSDTEPSGPPAQSHLPGSWLPLTAIPDSCRIAQNRLSSLSEPVRSDYVDFRSRLSLGPFAILLGILAFLLVSGVIAPMFFLTDKPEVARGWLLVPFAVGSLGLLGYYAFEMHRLRAAADLNATHI